MIPGPIKADDGSRGELLALEAHALSRHDTYLVSNEGHFSIDLVARRYSEPTAFEDSERLFWSSPLNENRVSHAAGRDRCFAVFPGVLHCLSRRDASWAPRRHAVSMSNVVTRCQGEIRTHRAPARSPPRFFRDPLKVKIPPLTIPRDFG